MKRINIFENGIYFVLEITDDNKAKLLHFAAVPFDENTIDEKSGTDGFQLVELQCSGIDRAGERHGNKYIVTAPAYRMKFKDFSDTNNNIGRRLDITTTDDETGLEAVSHFQFYHGTKVCRCNTTVTNKGSQIQTIEYVSSFALTGIEKEGILSWDDKMLFRLCHNSWTREIQWKTFTSAQAGLTISQPLEYQHSSRVFGISNAGNWSSKEYIPMGMCENTEVGTALFWQIENNGSWHWEISDETGHLYLQLSGPSEIESHWSKQLAPNESFESVPCAVGAVVGGFNEAMGELTKYRRLIRRKNYDNKKLAVIFNDYMNCLWGDPTAEKEFPLIDAAAQAGCEYYCIDAGWYADGGWWDEVGEWKESRRRFPNGLREITDYIRKKNMIAGVWLEIEVMGIHCPMAENCSDDWFFTRHGKRVYDRSRWQLDFRNPQVTDYCDKVIDRLIEQYGVGYIKMDYNIEPGIGTEHNADSFGDGLLGHERAYLSWLDRVFERHPQLIIENCSSGGLRMDYAMLSRYSIQSTSDQDDYRKYCTIAANAPSVLCPEQAAVWSYPITNGDKEAAAFNMINAMLLRIHQSGNLSNLDEERLSLVKEGIKVYKKIRCDIKDAIPFWSIGTSDFSDSFTSLGLRCQNNSNKAYIAVWRRESQNDCCTLPISFLKGISAKVQCIYPSFSQSKFEFHSTSGNLCVKLENPYSARLFSIEW